MKLHNLYVTPELVQKFITNLHLSKTCGLDISVLVLKKCEPGFSYILAELFNICLKELYFGDCWKMSSVVPVFENVGERGLWHKTAALLVFFLWLVKSLFLIDLSITWRNVVFCLISVSFQVFLINYMSSDSCFP